MLLTTYLNKPVESGVGGPVVVAYPDSFDGGVQFQTGTGMQGCTAKFLLKD